MKQVIFDIETGPLSDTELAGMIPKFDSDSVKTGNIKDEEKIRAKIVEAEANHRQSFVDKAALDALTGRVLAIGFIQDDVATEIICEDNEARMIERFWDQLREDNRGYVPQLIGFNICNFDLPFLIKRSWKHGVQIPLGLRNGKWWSNCVVDLREIWQMGDRMAHGSLDSISRHLGVGSKNGDGKNFHKLLVENRDEAMKYLLNDLELTKCVAERLGVVE